MILPALVLSTLQVELVVAADAVAGVDVAVAEEEAGEAAQAPQMYHQLRLMRRILSTHTSFKPHPIGENINGLRRSMQLFRTDTIPAHTYTRQSILRGRLQI